MLATRTIAISNNEIITYDYHYELIQIPGKRCSITEYFIMKWRLKEYDFNPKDMIFIGSFDELLFSSEEIKQKYESLRRKGKVNGSLSN